MSKEGDGKRAALGIWQNLVDILKEMDANSQETVKLYLELLASLPGTTLVDDDVRDQNIYIQGIIDLYNSEEFYVLSPKRRCNRQLAIRFYVDGWVIINRHYYNGHQLFSGSWIKGLEFIMEKIIQSSVRHNLLDNQKKAFRELIRQLQ